MTRKRLVTAVALGAVVLAAGVLVGVRLVGDDEPARSRIEAAVRLAPPDAEKLVWTDWEGVRKQVGLDLDDRSSGAQVRTLVDRAFEADLYNNSVLGSSAEALQERLGFSQATIEWELYAQSTEGASLIVQLPDTITLGEVEDRFRAVGYDDVGEGLLGSDADEDPITAELTGELAFVSVDAGHGLLVAGDSSAGVEAALASIEADDSQTVPAGVVAGVAGALSATLRSGADVCSKQAMSAADPADEAEGEALAAQAGDLNPLTGFAIAELPGDQVRVAMGFETEDQARTNADTRAVLASGPAPGQGGDFADIFTLDEVSAVGTTVTMAMTPVDGAYVVSDLSEGPLLFATC